jgi:TolA-binding protein
MNLAVRTILMALLFLLPLKLRAQGNQELVEEIKRMAGEMADLREANSVQSKRLSQMQRELDSLRESVRDSHDRATAKMGDFATREDLKKIVENIKDVDKRREEDRKLILAEFDKLGKTLSQQPTERPSRSGRNSKKESEPDKEPAPIEGTFLPVKVKDGQRLSDIQKEYNAALKEKGLPPVTLDQIKRANPKMNPNRILVGQEILLPVPDKKK